MIISIDNIRTEMKIEGVSKFIELLDLINEQLFEKNRVIFEVFVNGEKAHPNSNVDIANIKVMEISTKSPRILLLETINEMDSYIKRFQGTLDEIYLYLSNDDYRISELIVKVVDGLEWIYSVLTSVLDLTSIDFESIKFKDTYFNFEYILNYFLILVENEDFNGLQSFLNDDLKGFLLEIELGIPKVYEAIINEEKEDRVKA